MPLDGQQGSDPVQTEVQPAIGAPPQWFRRWWAWPLAVLALALAGYHLWIFCQVWWLREHNPRTTAFMQEGLERLRSKNSGARLQQRWVPYAQISVNLKRAVITAEDQRFLEHGGFDMEAMEKAYEKNARRGRIRRGASTISQQLAKNLFLSPNRTYLRKVHEAVITMIIEQVLSKRRILEIYLNVIEWGDGIYGAEAAAQHYFSESAAELKPKQAARLAAMIPNPRLFARDPDSSYLDERTEFLLGQMEYVRIP
jgi:monofunctional biosynthetic peptidoglycan transglycosylase